jgi:pyruvate,orthophosphate dikinase
MVFGNLDERSGTGVLFTRNPLTGSPEPYGEWLPKAQGEDVVSGRCDPLGLDALAEEQPAVHATLLELAATLERDGRDVQDIEFTVEGGRLWLLQTRAAKRTAAAAVRLAVDLANEGLIDRRTAVTRVTPDQLEALRRDHVEPVERGSAELLATGRPAATGVACGEVVTDVDEAEDRALTGEAIVLARATTNPDDVHAMSAVNAVLTEIGGTTSHAAVVSRELGTPCVVGCGPQSVTSLAGRTVTVDAAAGHVFAGNLVVTGAAADNPDLTALMSWARETTAPEHVR